MKVKSMAKRVIFIGGCSRSGTTMLADLLGSHEDVVVTPESQFIPESYRLFEKEGAWSALSYMQRNFRFHVWGVNLQFMNAERIEAFPDLIFALVDAYAKSIGKKRWSTWIDHTPSNLRHGSILKRAFPSAQLVHIVRDGRSVLASMKRLDWGHHNPVHAAEYWKDGVLPGLALKSSGQLAAQVRYEDVVRNPEVELRSLCRLLGVPYRHAEGGGFKVPRYTAKQHSLVGRGVSQARVTDWDILQERDVEIFEARTQTILTALGYRVSQPFPKDATRLERLLMADWPVRVYSRPLRRLRFLIRKARLVSTKPLKEAGSK